MINLPYGGKELNLGVEEGPSAVLSPEFLATWEPRPTLSEYTFPLPESIEREQYGEVLGKTLGELAELINLELKPGETQVVVGGDHSIATATLAAVLSRVNMEQVGYIQFDTHGDIHLFATSPSGNFHGMWLRPFLGPFDHTAIQALAPGKLKPEQILYIGNLDLEPEEQDFFAQNHIKNLTRSELVEKKGDSRACIEQFLQRFAHVHVSFDIDVFDLSLVSATGTPSQDGLFWEEAEPILQLLSQQKSLSVDLVEVNPRKMGAEATIEMAQRVLRKLLGL